MTIEIPFAVNAFVLLGIERILYGSWFIYPESFKAAVRKGTFGESIKNEPLYWKCAMTLGTYIKVFQFSVVIFDLLVQCDIVNPMEVDSKLLALGVLLLAVGQGLNIAVFNALEGVGVYYGYEFGYPVKMVSLFPYNVSWISDPQYWGVVMTVWGIYFTLGASSYTVPLLETFWYVTSMKFLEHSRGRKLVKSILGEDIKIRK
jgi:hypothetical protein